MLILNPPCGKVQGFEDNNCQCFLGIPYAKPPVGELRLKPPQACDKWEGVRDCTKYGNAAPQLDASELKATSIRVLKEGETLSEDCLYLNVFTPNADNKKRPVLVFIHAGAFQKGSGTLFLNPKTYNDEDIVVIGVNYRLGALGFLDFSEYLGDEYNQSGNNGILDVVQALKWVKENIATFGGDPDNVTVMGNSAGGKIVSTLSIMKTAKGYFNKLIAISGGVQCTRDKKTAYKITERFMKDANLTKENAHKLLEMPWKDIVKAQTDLFSGLNLHTCGPVFDGVNFEGNNALDIIRNENANYVPIICGTNRDEMQFYYHAYKFHELDDYMAKRLFGDNAPIVKKGYEKIKDADNFPEKFVDFATEYIYRNGSYQLCSSFAKAGYPIYMFRNDYDKQPMRACHTSETQFTMREYDKYKTEKDEAFYNLADAIVEALANFMRTGIPSSSKLPTWPKFTEEDKKMMVFNETSSIEACPIPYVEKDLPEQIFILR